MSLPVSTNPWVVLSLDGATATEADIKRAYAALLKEHRPDRDPANFQRLRDARDEAMERLKGRPPVDLEPAIVLEPSPEDEIEAPPLAIPVPEVVPPPVPVRPRLSPLQDAISRRDVEAARQALADLRLDPARWSQAIVIASHMLGARDVIDAALDPADFVPAVNEGVAEAPLDWLRHMIAKRNFHRPAALATALLAQVKDLSTPGVIELYYRLAKAIAVSHPELARPLADLAYQASPIYRRQFENVSRWVFIGQQFEPLAAEVRHEWNRVLHRAEAGDRFFDEPFLGALMLETRRTMRGDWLGYRIIREFLPPGLYARIKGPGERLLRPRRRHRGAAGFPVWIFIAGMFMVSVVLPFMMKDDGHQTRTPAIPVEQRDAHLERVAAQSLEVREAYRALERRGVRALPDILRDLPSGTPSLAATVIDLYVDAPWRTEQALLPLPPVASQLLGEPQKRSLGRKLMARPDGSPAFQSSVLEHLLPGTE